MCADGIVYMDAGEQVGGRICGVKLLYQIHAEIVPRKDLRAQLVAVGVYGGDDQEQGHPCDQERAHSPAGFPVAKGNIKDGHRYVYKPEIIGDHKKLAERDVVIQRHMDDMVIGMDIDFFLHIAEPGNINRGVEQQEKMFVILQKGKDLFHVRTSYLSVFCRISCYPGNMDHIHISYLTGNYNMISCPVNSCKGRNSVLSF